MAASPSSGAGMVNPARAGMILDGYRATLNRKSKPRASGDDPCSPFSIAFLIAVNPARAGMILPGLGVCGARKRKPRASGDDPGAVPLLRPLQA